MQAVMDEEVDLAEMRKYPRKAAPARTPYVRPSMRLAARCTDLRVQRHF
jgi:hypothetical protein